jgi:hypothetical protein
MSANGTRSHLLEILGNHKSKKKALLATIQKQLDEIEENIKAIERTLRLIEQSTVGTSKIHKFIVSPDEVRANTKTQMKALKYIARHSDGTVHYSEATDILIGAGMTHGKRRNVAAHLYNLMHNHPEDWEWIAPGRFKLLETRETKDILEGKMKRLPIDIKWDEEDKGKSSSFVS